MPGGLFDVSVLDTVNPMLSDLAALLRQVISDATGIGTAILQDYAHNAQIEARSSTSVGFKSFANITTAKHPIALARDGRWGTALTDPTPVTITGVAGTKYVYVDIASNGALTLVASTTAPGSEATSYRKPLGEVGWDGAAITDVLPYFGNSIAPGDIGTVELADGSVTTAKLADAAVTDAKLSAGRLPRGYVAGLGIANNATDASNDIDVAVGECRNDGNDGDITLTSALTKQLDAAWTVGNNAGGLDTGTKAASTWYHVWAIKRIDTGVIDVLFSTSATAPTMPSGYTKKRRIGSILTDGTSNIIAFTQNGDHFKWAVASAGSAQNPGTAAVTRTLTVPDGIVVEAEIFARTVHGTTTTIWGLLTALDETDSAPDGSKANFGGVVPATTGAPGLGSMTRIKTNTSRQIRSRLSASGANDWIGWSVHGWYDRRGRDD